MAARCSCLVQDGPFGSLVDRFGFCSGVSDGGQPYSSAFGEAADHVEDDADLSGLVEVKAVAGDDVEEIVDCQCAQAG